MTQTRSGKSAAAGDKHDLDESSSQRPSKAQKKDDSEEGGEGKKQLTLDESLNGSVAISFLDSHSALPQLTDNATH